MPVDGGDAVATDDAPAVIAHGRRGFEGGAPVVLRSTSGNDRRCVETVCGARAYDCGGVDKNYGRSVKSHDTSVRGTGPLSNGENKSTDGA
jgi:hypothetical protein